MEIIRKNPSAKASRLSIGAYYRILSPNLLLPMVEKCIYLDSDIVVNMDINELWQIDLGQKILGAVTSKSDNKELCIEGFVKFEDYFNSGVLLMNLNSFLKEKNAMLSALSFLSENPKLISFQDQDLLNYCFSTQTLKLSPKFNQGIFYLRKRKNLFVDKEIYHFAGDRLSLDLNDPFNRLWMSYFAKTPWFNEETIRRLYENFQEVYRQLHADENKSKINLSVAMSGKTRAFITSESGLGNLVKNFAVKSDEEMLIIKPGAPLQKLIDLLKTSRDKKIFFIMIRNFPFNVLTEAGLVQGRDFFNGFDFLTELNINSYTLLKDM